MSKYRPSCPVLVVTADEAVGRQTGAIFAQFPMVVDDLSPGKFAWDKESPAIAKAKEMGLYSGNGSNIVVLAGSGGGDADKCPLVSFLE
jgi:pyruvate kinase